MNVILFGATGMIGSGALIECLEHPDVERVLVVGRRPCGVVHGKLAELVHDDFFDFSSVQEALHGYDACFFCVGVTSAGMSEEAYHRVTYDMTIAVGCALLEANPELTFCYISGVGADSSEEGRIMWARVRGKLENELLRMDFGSSWILRPAFVQPLKGVRSRTAMYNAFYTVLGPLQPLLKVVASGWVTTTEKVGLALIRVARDGGESAVMENAAINRLGQAEAAARATSEGG